MAAPSTSDLVKRLPYTMRLRFNSLGAFVRAVIDEQAQRNPEDRSLTQDELAEVQLAAFIYSLDDFLRQGTHAARTAATTFEAMDIPGFTVGATTFTSNNDETLRGERLADALKEIVRGTRLDTLMRRASSMRGLVRSLRSEIIGAG